METVIPILIEILRQYGYLIIFFGVMIGGEVILLPAVFLASLGLMNIFGVIVFGLAGTMISDSGWYLAGKKAKGKNYFSRIINYEKYRPRIDLWKNKFNNYNAKILILSKFVYGTRIITLMSSGYQKLPYEKFLKFNFIGSFLWLAFIVVLGYGMGLSWQYLKIYGDYVQYLALFGLLALFVIRYAFQKAITILNYERNRRHQGQN